MVFVEDAAFVANKLGVERRSVGSCRSIDRNRRGVETIETSGGDNPINAFTSLDNLFDTGRRTVVANLISNETRAIKAA